MKMQQEEQVDDKYKYIECQFREIGCSVTIQLQFTWLEMPYEEAKERHLINKLLKQKKKHLSSSHVKLILMKFHDRAHSKEHTTYNIYESIICKEEELKCKEGARI